MRSASGGGSPTAASGKFRLRVVGPTLGNMLRSPVADDHQLEIFCTVRIDASGERRYQRSSRMTFRPY
jgi:hypothetical protein